MAHRRHPNSGPARPHQKAALRERRKLQVSHRFLRATQALGDRRPGRVLELGCGHGILLSELHRQWPGMALVGVDRSHPMLAIARSRNQEALALGRLQLLEADVLDAWPSLGAFEAIVTVNFGPLGFPETRSDRVKCLAGLLAPGGVWMDFHDSPYPDAIDRHAHHSERLLGLAGLATRRVSRSTQWVETHGVRR